MPYTKEQLKNVDFYQDFGFIVEYSKDFEIGEGFYMNDFVMSYTL